MAVHVHGSARGFLEEAESLLLQHEAENCFLLGTAGEWTGGGVPEGNGLLTMTDGAGKITAAVLVHPIHVMTTRARAETVEELVEYLAESSWGVPSINAPEPTADLFAELWERRTGQASELYLRQGIHKLEAIEPDLPATSGTARWASEDDTELVADWVSRFGDEVEIPMNGPKVARVRIAMRAILLWEFGGRPVTMAAWSGPTKNGVRINLVYTPEELRGHGYATACTAEITRRLLAEGKRYCFLYTDLANPTSNKIYFRIGYRPVCNVHSYRFTQR